MESVFERPFVEKTLLIIVTFSPIPLLLAGAKRQSREVASLGHPN